MGELAYLVFSSFVHTADRMVSEHTQYSVFMQFYSLFVVMLSSKLKFKMKERMLSSLKYMVVLSI